MKTPAFPIYNDPVIDSLLSFYAKNNQAARVYLETCQEQDWPCIVDHIALRCFNVETRAAIFVEHGYVFENERVEYPDQGWWANIYRRPESPVLFIDQAYDDARGRKSIIPDWVRLFGDQHLHHAAMLVENIEHAVSVMKNRGIAFSGEIVGHPGSRLRQIFTAAEVKNDAPYTVLELTERNNYTGFYPDQADALMQSSTRKTQI